MNIPKTEQELAKILYDRFDKALPVQYLAYNDVVSFVVKDGGGITIHSISDPVATYGVTYTVVRLVPRTFWNTLFTGRHGCRVDGKWYIEKSVETARVQIKFDGEDPNGFYELYQRFVKEDAERTRRNTLIKATTLLQ